MEYNEGMGWIFFKSEEPTVCVYHLDRHDKATNTAFLTLYKNPSDFTNNVSLKGIEVEGWFV